MKIIHLISGGDTGGAKTHVHSLLANLSKTEQILLVCFTKGEFSDEAQALGIPILIMEGSVLSCVGRLRRIINGEGYEIVHCHGARGNMVGALLKRFIKAPVMTTVHSDYKLDYMGRPLANVTYGKINALALRSMDYYMGVSGFMKDQLIARGFDPNDIFTIYNGVDFERAAPKYSRSDFYARLGIPAEEGDVIVGIAARLDPVKDMATLVRAFALALKEQPSLRLVIAGEGAERENLMALADELGVADRFHLAGWIGNMDEYYQSIDINTLTSISETFPYAVTEGAFNRLPTVTSRVGGVPSLVKHMQTGLIFEIGDYKAMGRYLAMLAGDAQLRKRLGDAIHDKAAAEFSVEATGRRQKQVYAEIMRRRGKKKNGLRDGVIICGAYGHGNTGDEAILEAIVGQMRLINPDIPLTVLSRRPKETKRRYGVRAIYTFDPLRTAGTMRRAGLYLSGGGSLMQDVTSRRSLWYYLTSITRAKKFGCKVIMYGCGIGPVVFDGDRKKTAEVLNSSVDVITLRESYSVRELEKLGVTKPEIILSADPVFTLDAADCGRIDAELEKQGMEPDGRYIGFALRPWYGFGRKVECLISAVGYAYESYGLTPVFISMNQRDDSKVAEKIAEGLNIPFHIIAEPLEPRLNIGVISRMAVMVSMRLHGLIFAASQGVPLVGVSYDPKVTAFIDSIDERNCIGIESMTSDGLRAAIDRAVSAAVSGESTIERMTRVRELESRNIMAVKKLMGV